MNTLIESFITGLDKTTVDGFAEALLIAMMSLTDKNGLLLAVRMDNDPNENIRLAKEVARMMLKEKTQ